MSDSSVGVAEPTAGLFVVALPELDDGTARRLEAIRAANDPLHDRIGGHFTFVFGVHGRAPDDIEAEVRQRVASMPSFAFEARFTAVRHDAVARRFYASLVPELGVTAMLSLHASLNAGWLRKYLRRDIDFVPHLSLARSEDLGSLDQLAADLNRDGFAVAGRIASLDVVDVRPTAITSVAHIELRG